MALDLNPYSSLYQQGNELPTNGVLSMQGSNAPPQIGPDQQPIPAMNVPIPSVDSLQNIPAMPQQMMQQTQSSQMMPSQQPQISPNGPIAQILGQYLKTQQSQSNQNGLIQQILSNRMQPDMQDAARSTIQTAQAYGAPDLFKAATPVQAMNDRITGQLTPYASALSLNDAQIKNQFALPNAQADLALKQAQTQAQLAQSGAMFGFGGGAQGGAQQGAISPNGGGDQYLSTLPPQIAAQVKAIAEGRQQFPTGMALKTPYWQQMISAVSTYDPSFDAVNYNARVAARKDFTSGKSAQTINALNTGIGHLDQLQKAVAGLNNGSFPALNSAENYISTQTGGTGPSNFQAIKNSVAPELVRIWRGSGGSEADIQGRLSDLSDAKSPEQLNGVIKEIAGLMQSKIDALGDQYKRGMGTAANDTQFYTPKSQAILKSLGLDTGNPDAGVVQQPNNTSGGKSINFSDLPQ